MLSRLGRTEGLGKGWGLGVIVEGGGLILRRVFKIDLFNAFVRRNDFLPSTGAGLLHLGLEAASCSRGGDAGKDEVAGVHYCSG